MNINNTIIRGILGAGILLAADYAHAQTQYTWNGGTSGSWTTAANWNSSTIMPTGITNSNARLNVLNGANNICTYAAAQGDTVITTTSGTRALIVGNGTAGALVITGGTLETRQVTGSSPDVLGNGTAPGTLTISGGNYICTNGVVNELDMPINNSTVTVSNALTINSGSAAVSTIYINEAQASGGGSSSTISLNGGTLGVATIKSGTTAFLSTINFNGGVLQALLSDNIIQYTIKTLNVLAGGAIVDTHGFSVYIVPALLNGTGGGDDGGLTKVGSGTLTLVGTNTYTGGTVISNGTLALAVSGTTGSICNSTNISINAGTTFDVSGLTSPYNFSTTNTLSASGTGTTTGTGAATIYGASSGTVSLGSQPITLKYDGLHPALYISQGTLSLNGNAFTVNTTNGLPLTYGTYTLVQQASGNITTNGSFTVSGNAIASGTEANISVSGGNVNLLVFQPVATTMTAYRTAGTTLKVPLSDIATNWSDAGGYPVNLTGVNLTTTNGQTLCLLNVTTNSGSFVITNVSFVGYTNGPNVNDQFSYSIADGQGGTNIGFVNIVILTNLTGQTTGLVNPGGSAVTVNFAGWPGYSYSVQRATNMVTPVWVTILTTNAPSGGLFNYTDNFTDLGGVPSSAYYRLSWQL